MLNWYLYFISILAVKSIPRNKHLYIQITSLHYSTGSPLVTNQLHATTA